MKIILTQTMMIIDVRLTEEKNIFYARNRFRSVIPPFEGG
jgi:hypothetical protein